MNSRSIPFFYSLVFFFCFLGLVVFKLFSRYRDYHNTIHSSALSFDRGESEEAGSFSDQMLNDLWKIDSLSETLQSDNSGSTDSLSYSLLPDGKGPGDADNQDPGQGGFSLKFDIFDETFRSLSRSVDNLTGQSAGQGIDLAETRNFVQKASSSGEMTDPYIDKVERGIERYKSLDRRLSQNLDQYLEREFTFVRGLRQRMLKEKKRIIISGAVGLLMLGFYTVVTYHGI